MDDLKEENPRNRSAVYKFSGKVFRWIEEITKEQTFDLVIVGNNQGIGVHKASCIPETLKSKTIIVWHKKQRDRRYEDLGFIYFAGRNEEELKPLILEILK